MRKSQPSQFIDELVRGDNGQRAWDYRCPACDRVCSRTTYQSTGGRQLCCDLCPGPASHEKAPRDEITRNFVNGRRYPKAIGVEIGGVDQAGNYVWTAAADSFLGARGVVVSDRGVIADESGVPIVYRTPGTVGR